MAVTYIKIVILVAWLGEQCCQTVLATQEKYGSSYGNTTPPRQDYPSGGHRLPQDIYNPTPRKLNQPLGANNMNRDYGSGIQSPRNGYSNGVYGNSGDTIRNGLGGLNQPLGANNMNRDYGSGIQSSRNDYTNGVNGNSGDTSRHGLGGNSVADQRANQSPLEPSVRNTSVGPYPRLGLLAARQNSLEPSVMNNSASPYPPLGLSAPRTQVQPSSNTPLSCQSCQSQPATPCCCGQCQPATPCYCGQCQECQDRLAGLIAARNRLQSYLKPPSTTPLSGQLRPSNNDPYPSSQSQEYNNRIAGQAAIPYSGKDSTGQPIKPCKDDNLLMQNMGCVVSCNDKMCTMTTPGGEVLVYDRATGQFNPQKANPTVTHLPSEYDEESKKWVVSGTAKRPSPNPSYNSPPLAEHNSMRSQSMQPSAIAAPVSDPQRLSNPTSPGYNLPGNNSARQGTSGSFQLVPASTWMTSSKGTGVQEPQKSYGVADPASLEHRSYENNSAHQMYTPPPPQTRPSPYSWNK